MRYNSSRSFLYFSSSAFSLANRSARSDVTAHPFTVSIKPKRPIVLSDPTASLFNSTRRFSRHSISWSSVRISALSSEEAGWGGPIISARLNSQIPSLSKPKRTFDMPSPFWYAKLIKEQNSNTSNGLFSCCRTQFCAAIRFLQPKKADKV